MMRALALASLSWVLFAAATADANIQTPEAEIILAMQAAVRANDKEWFAAHLHLPVRYYGKSFRMIHSKAWFLRHYPTVIGPELKASILAQDSEDYLKNYQGVMVGEGSHNIWLQDFGDPGAGIPSKYEIITINNSD